MKDSIIGEFDNCYIEGNRIKTEMYYQTFFNSEAVRMVELYLKEKKQKDDILNDDSWLFVNIKTSPNGKYTKCKYNTFSESMKVVCRKLDIKNITPKSLRRYFNTVLKRGKIDFEIKERLLGHKVDISKGSVYDEILNDDYRFAKYYSEKIESLKLLGNGNQKITKVDERVKQLEKDIDNLKRANEQLRNENERFNEILMKMGEKFEKVGQFLKYAEYKKDIEIDLDLLSESIKRAPRKTL